MLNKQKPQKPVMDDGSFLRIHSMFHTIQGEGPFAGTPAIFIRLAGCNLQCPLCDTEYTGGHLYSVQDAVQRTVSLSMAHARTGLVVLTGGEPLRQPIGPLCERLLYLGFRVQVETNGTLFRELPSAVTVVCSPKTGQVNAKLLPTIAAFKYVATVGSLAGSPDGLPMSALDHAAAPRLFRKPAGHPAEVYLQPVDEQDAGNNARNLEAVVASCQQYGHRLCLQVHKLIGVA
jgi:7-carboxy-7-deazaguanine synthase